MKLLCFAFNNTSCCCFCNFFAFTIPLVTVSITMKLLENVILVTFYCNETIRKCDVLLLTIPLVSVSIAMKLLEHFMFCF